jgi:hypothetical protein
MSQTPRWDSAQSTSPEGNLPVVATFIHRLIGAAALDSNTYEEVEGDRTATTQAFAIVLASSLATGIGATGLGAHPLGDVLFMSIAALLGWAAWALLVFEVGGRLMPEPQTQVDVPELLRTIGFASTPGLFRVLGVLPMLTIPVFALTAVWMLAAMIVAVRQALDFTSTARALAVCVVGWLIAGAFAVAMGLWLTPPVF